MECGGTPGEWCVCACACVFMARVVILLFFLHLPPTHSKCISVKHLLTSHCDFAHLLKITVANLPHTGILSVCVCVWLKSNMSTSSKDVATSEANYSAQV